MNVIEGFYDKTIMKDEKNGFTIFSLIPETAEGIKLNKYGTVTCKGITPPYQKNEYIRVEGDFDEDIYGPFINITKISEACKNRASSIRYLASSLFGLTYEQASKVVDKYGIDIYAFAEREDAAAQLAQTLGMSERKALVIINSILNTRHWRELFEYGFDKNLSYNTISRIVEAYGGRAKTVLCSDPYEIGMKYGASFATCDAIAFDNGGHPINKKRICTVAKMLLNKYQNSGDVFTYQGDLLEGIKQQLSLKSSFVVPMVVISSALAGFKDICIERDSKNRIYLYENKFAEQNVAKQIKRLLDGAKPLPYTDDIVAYAEKECGVTLAPEQRESLGLLKQTGLAILTGGPGTGKTTTMKAIIAAYKKMNPTGCIKLCAPSGRAAQRMSESTGMEASTIHRLLEYKPFGAGGSSHKDAQDPIEAELIIVDEGSMVDLSIASMLLSAVKTGSLVLIAGDINQLQSVGCGDVLNDLIKSKVIPVVQLKKVYRQAADSPIISNAYAINNGISQLVEDEHFEIIECTAKNITDSICAIVQKYYKPDDPFYVQVLCPTHKGEGGVSKINKKLQEKLNPSKGKSLMYGGTEFRLNDKIIMLKNNPNMGYYNGDVGVVKEVGNSELVVEIQSSRIVLTKDLLDDIKLAYAMSIHKSQGSEFPITIVSLPTCGMLQRNLLYTGVTRGKETVIIVQEPGNIERSVMRCEVGKRNSMLAERIRNERK